MRHDATRCDRGQDETGNGRLVPVRTTQPVPAGSRGVPVPAHPITRRWSLTRLVVSASAVALTAVLLAGVLLLLTLEALADAQERQAQAQDARQSLSTLMKSYVDQETGLRGYLVVQDARLLDPWRTAEAQIPSLEQAVQADAARLGAPPELVQSALDAHARWGQYADQQRERVADGRAQDASLLVETLRGKQLFDDLRAQGAALDGWLADQQQRDERRAGALQQRLATTLTVAMAVFAGALVCGFTVLWRGVTTPLARLSRASRTVAAGDLSAELPSGGSSEVRALAGDVAAMRDRLTADLWRTRRALDAVAQSEPALDALQRDLLGGPFADPSWSGWSAADLAPSTLTAEHAATKAGWTDLEVQARIEPAEGVLGGDWCDLVELTPTRLAVVAGDVAGHGAASAVFAHRLKHALATALPLVDSPAGALRVLARQLDGVDAELFATLFVAVVDRLSDQLTYANAGHPPGLLISGEPARVRSGTSGLPRLATAPGRAVSSPPTTPVCRELPVTGPMVSPVLPEAEWTQVVLDFPPGCRLLLYTDGVLEARDAQGREFGLQGIRQAVLDHSRQGVGRLVDAVEAAAIRHSRLSDRSDDHTLLTVTRRGLAGAPRTPF